MAGIADALASVLYPNTTKDSLYSIGGQSILKSQMPVFKNPWTSLLANTAQGLVGYGLQGYGQQVVNEQNAENAAKMVPQLGQLGVKVTPEIQAGLTNTDPQKRALALALVERDMSAASKAAEQQQDFNLFKQKEDYKKSLTDGVSGKDQFDRGKQIRSEVDGPPLKAFAETDRYFKAMISAATKDDKISDISMISNLAKLRDPTSVVREGEYKVSADVASALDNQFGNWRAVVEGKAKLNPEIRSRMLGAAKDYWDSSRGLYEVYASKYADLAKRSGLEERDVIMMPYKQEDYADFLKTIPTAEQIQQAFNQQTASAQLRQIQPRAPIVGSMGSQPQELIPVAPLPAPAADQQYIQIAPNQYIRIQKGK
jgi:hypothetical protein